MSESSQANNATTQHVEAGGITFAYRALGRETGVPLVLLQRFRGTMDEWDPALLDALAAGRRVILFDNAGVSLSSGETPETITGMAERAADFVEALGYERVDLLGWSMGGAVAQRLALDRPALVRRLVLAGTGPGTVPGSPRMPERVLDVMQKPVNDDEDFLYLFFHDSPSSQAAGAAHLARLHRRVEAPAPRVKPRSVKAQLAAIGAWVAGKDSTYSRLAEIQHPTLVANGAHDIMIPAASSFAMSQRMPRAHLVLHPDAGHGFLFQYADRFARHVGELLDEG